MLSTATEEIISIIDPRVLSIKIKESYESMVDLIDQKEISYGPSPEIPNNTDYTKVRQTVYDKLLAAQQILPSHLRFCLYEGYRSLSLQEKMFNDRYCFLKQQYADWNQQKLFYETVKLVSPVLNLDGSRNVPPHATGAAIDVYLIDKNNNMVDMGIAPKDWMQDIDGSLSRTNSVKISQKAKINRVIMKHALHKVGFINYPREYWHWSYGDKYWAFQVDRAFALYDIV